VEIPLVRTLLVGINWRKCPEWDLPLRELPCDNLLMGTPLVRTLRLEIPLVGTPLLGTPMVETPLIENSA